LLTTRQVTIYCGPTANQIGCAAAHPINLRRREPQVWVTQVNVGQPAGRGDHDRHKKCSSGSV
jgi:hypothetical protein